jgi:predicted PurR-regulated permease PerM
VVRLSTLWGPVERWGDYRRRQRAALEESNRIDTGALPVVPPGPPSGPPTGDGAGRIPVEPGPAADTSGSPATGMFGAIGQPLNRHSPFYIGFFGASGAMLAFGLWTGLARLATTVTLLVVSFFLALTLNPIVERLVARRMARGSAVAVVFSGLIVVFVIIGFLVVPPVVTQGSALAQQSPQYLQDLLNTRWVRELDQHYNVIDRIQAELSARLTDQSFLEGVLGGILGVGQAVLSGVFQVLTVLVLTLYLLSSLPRVKSAAYAVVPATRRARVVSLSEEIMRRVGSYAIGQVLIATLNACMSWIMMTIVGIPYAAVLAVSVGLLGLVPMIGATLGAGIVCVVAFFDEPKKALIALIYYVVYQQIENYVIAPRVMQRTVSVPGTVTIVAALTGGALLGILGALLAIPVAAGLLLLYEEVLVPRQRQA